MDTQKTTTQANKKIILHKFAFIKRTHIICITIFIILHKIHLVFTVPPSLP